eukprot:4358408-Pyramimonas_sp.AAC.1
MPHEGVTKGIFPLDRSHSAALAAADGTAPAHRGEIRQPTEYSFIQPIDLADKQHIPSFGQSTAHLGEAPAGGGALALVKQCAGHPAAA